MQHKGARKYYLLLQLYSAIKETHFVCAVLWTGTMRSSE
jgi:hypothetical protein